MNLREAQEVGTPGAPGWKKWRKNLFQRKVQHGPKVTSYKHGEITPLIIGVVQQTVTHLNVSEIYRDPFIPPFITIGFGAHLALPLLPYSKKRPIVKETILERKRNSKKNSIRLRFCDQNLKQLFVGKPFPDVEFAKYFFEFLRQKQIFPKKIEDARIFKSKQLTVYSPSRGPGDRTFKSKNPAVEFHHLDDQSRIFWTKKRPQKGSKLQEFHPFPPIFP